MKSPAAVYRIFQRDEGAAPSVRTVIISLVVAAAIATAIGVIRVARQHEVLRLGFELSRRTEQVTRMQEANRELELELATLTAPERIRRLATRLGMAPVAPDRIRVISAPAASAQTPAPDRSRPSPIAATAPTSPTSADDRAPAAAVATPAVAPTDAPRARTP